MFNKNFLAVEINERTWKIAIGRPNINTNQVELLHVATYSDVKELKAAISKYSIGHTIYCVNNRNGITFVTRNLTASSFESERAIRSDSNSNQCYDYFNMGSSAILVSLPKDNIDQIRELHPALGLKCPFSVIHNDSVNVYGFTRNYGERSRITAALVNVQQDHVSIIISQYNTIKMVLFFNIAESMDPIQEIVSMLHGGSEYCEMPQPVQVPVDRSINSNGSEKSATVELPNLFTYDVVVFSGETTIDDAIEVKSLAMAQKLKIREVDMLDILRSGFINIDALSTTEKFMMEGASHAYAVVVNTIAMRCENVGVDLTVSKNTLGKTTPINPEVKIQQEVMEKLITNVNVLVREVAPAIVHQKFILILAVLFTLSIAGYRYYLHNNDLVKLQTQYTAEKTKENSLLATKIIYDDLKRRNSLKNERIKAVEAIQKTQLVVPTIMRDIQGYLSESNFRELITINQLAINGSEVKIAGTALDKIKVGLLASTLQQHNYDDVIPVRYTAIDAVQCSYELTTRYVGYVPVNPIMNLPPQTQIQVAVSQPVNQPISK